LEVVDVWSQKPLQQFGKEPRTRYIYQ